VSLPISTPRGGGFAVAARQMCNSNDFLGAFMSAPLSLAFADLSYIDPFIEQASYVLERMFTIKTSAGRPKAKAESMATHDVTGLVPLYGPMYGKFGISLPSAMACAFASKLLQRTIVHVGREATDIAGELANNITGRAAAAFAGAGLRIGLPEVVVGRGRPLNFGGVPTPLVVPIECSLGSLTLEIGIALNAASQLPSMRYAMTGVGR
jgi:chemotaxis protein CheX